MKLELKLLKEQDGPNDGMSLKRLIAFTGFILLSIALVFDAVRDGRVAAEVYVTYPLGVTILYAPQLALQLIKAWKGYDNRMEGQG